ncbi:MAG: hypothetical protein ABJB40_01285, partial [Acidobacteriota bacterium]
MKKQIIFPFFAMFFASFAVSAQSRQPSTAIKPYVVRSKQALADLERKLAADKTDVASKNLTVTK